MQILYFLFIYYNSENNIERALISAMVMSMFYYSKFINWLEKTDKTLNHVSNYHKETYYQHIIVTAGYAALHNSDRPLFIASLLHDIGKPETFVLHPDKGSTFYNHETHLDLVKEFLTEDDKDYCLVCDLIKLHMLPYKFNGPEPWRSYAEKQMLEIIHKYDGVFMSYLFLLHEYDVGATFSEYAPEKSIIRNYKNAVETYVLYKNKGEV